jgi:hypothetical protein
MKKEDYKEITNWEAIVVHSNEALKPYMRNVLTVLGEDLIEQATKDLSVEHAWSNLFINYNNQVRNGGHEQYVENRYHTDHDDSYCDQEGNMHQKLTSLTEEMSKKYDIPELKDFLLTLKEFKISVSEDEYTDVWDDDEQEEVEGYNPDYQKPKEATNGLFGKLDGQYFNYQDSLIDKVGAVLKDNLMLRQTHEALTGKKVEQSQTNKKTPKV